MDRRVVIRGEGVTLSLLVWRRHGRPVPGLVEAALRANPGLAAAMRPHIPVGRAVDLPDPPAPAAPAVIRLWD